MLAHRLFLRIFKTPVMGHVKLGLPQSGRTDLVQSLVGILIHIPRLASKNAPRMVNLLKTDARILGHGCMFENATCRHFVVTDKSQR